MSVKSTNTHNPILPLEYHFPDCEAHVMPDGNLYLYGSFDKDEKFFCSNEYHVVSTTDMKNWTIHELSFHGDQVSWFGNPDAPKYLGVDWSRPTEFVKEKMPGILEMFGPEAVESGTSLEVPSLLYAPDCIFKNGKYYLYFCMSDESEGVAVSDSPVGPFTNPVQLPIGEIDPAVFVDEDGSAYLYWGQFYSKGVRLNDDMVSLDPEKIAYNLVTEQEHYFHEGSSMRKIGDTYYYVFADIEHGKPTSLGYATGASPLGPFTYRGVIIDNAFCDPESWNNHGSIECFKGQWYVFYHRSSRGGQANRRLCIEPITILPDGTIPEVKMTSQGPGKPFGPGEPIYGYQACEVHGKCFIDTDGKGSEYLKNIIDGDYAVFRYVQSEQGFSKARIQTEGTGTVTVNLDGTAVGTARIEENGWNDILLKNTGESGKEQELVLEFSESSDFCMREFVLLT